MSSYSGDAAEQVVRMSLEGTEVAVRLAGSGARELAVLLYAVLKDQKKTSGRVRLANMLRSGKELKVFAVRDQDLQKFCEEAKRYGVLYTVLKDRDAKDGLTDIMVRADDAGKINRIFERFRLAAVHMGSVLTESGRERSGRTKDAPVTQSERTMTHQEKVEAFLDAALKPDPPEKEAPSPNPAGGRTVRSRPSGPSSVKKPPTARDASDGAENRSSVRKQLEDIRADQKKTAEAKKKTGRQQTQEAKAPGKKKNKAKGELSR